MVSIDILKMSVVCILSQVCSLQTSAILKHITKENLHVVNLLQF